MCVVGNGGVRCAPGFMVGFAALTTTLREPTLRVPPSRDDKSSARQTRSSVFFSLGKEPLVLIRKRFALRGGFTLRGRMVELRFAYSTLLAAIRRHRPASENPASNPQEKSNPTAVVGWGERSDAHHPGAFGAEAASGAKNVAGCIEGLRVVCGLGGHRCAHPTLRATSYLLTDYFNPTPFVVTLLIQVHPRSDVHGHRILGTSPQ